MPPTKTQPPPPSANNKSEVATKVHPSRGDIFTDFHHLAPTRGTLLRPIAMPPKVRSQPIDY